jgi:hypothetical protein
MGIRLYVTQCDLGFIYNHGCLWLYVFAEGDGPAVRPYRPKFSFHLHAEISPPFPHKNCTGALPCRTKRRRSIVGRAASSLPLDAGLVPT